MTRNLRAFLSTGADQSWPHETKRGVLRLRYVDLLRCAPATREEVRHWIIELQNATMDLARHDARPDSLATATLTYTEQILDPSVDWIYNAVVVFYADDQAVAFTGGRSQARTIDGQAVELIASSQFTHLEWRGLGLMNAAFPLLTVRYAQRHLLTDRPRYFMGIGMNPSTYRYICQAPAVVPSPTYDPPPQMQQVYRATFDPITDEDGLVPDGHRMVLSDSERARYEATDDVSIQYFLEKNPRFAEGFGLPILVRLTAADMVVTLARIGRANVSRRLRRARFRRR